MSWSLRELGELVGKVSSWNPVKSDSATSFNYIDLSSIDKDRKVVDLGAVPKVEPQKAPSRARQLVVANDVVVATVRPNLNGVAHIGSDLDGATASTGYCVLRPLSNKLDSRYLFYWVQSKTFVSDMMAKATGANYPAVTDKIIKQSYIPLPSLDEQKRIAAILGKADAIRRKRQQAIQLADDFLCSVFLDMFGDPVTNPKGWELKSLSELCEIRGGGTPSKRNDNFWGGDIPWVSPKDMKSIYIYTTIDKITNEAIVGSSTKLIDSNSVLMVVRSGVLKHTIPLAINTVPVTINQDMKAFCCSKMLNEKYLLFCLKSFSQFLLRTVRGTTADNLSSDVVNNLLIPVPPITQQKKFAEIVSSANKYQDRTLNGKDLKEENFKSLSQKAFAGEL